MTIEELASLVFDEGGLGNGEDLDTIIRLSSLSDHALVRRFFRYDDCAELQINDLDNDDVDILFSACNTLEDAKDAVVDYVASAPLTESDKAIIREHVRPALARAATALVEKRGAKNAATKAVYNDAIKTIVDMVVSRVEQSSHNFLSSTRTTEN